MLRRYRPEFAPENEPRRTKSRPIGFTPKEGTASRSPILLWAGHVPPSGQKACRLKAKYQEFNERSTYIFENKGKRLQVRLAPAEAGRIIAIPKAAGIHPTVRGKGLATGLYQGGSHSRSQSPGFFRKRYCFRWSELKELLKSKDLAQSCPKS